MSCTRYSSQNSSCASVWLKMGKLFSPLFSNSSQKPKDGTGSTKDWSASLDEWSSPRLSIRLRDPQIGSICLSMPESVTIVWNKRRMRMWDKSVIGRDRSIRKLNYRQVLLKWKWAISYREIMSTVDSTTSRSTQASRQAYLVETKWSKHLLLNTQSLKARSSIAETKVRPSRSLTKSPRSTLT